VPRGDGPALNVLIDSANRGFVVIADPTARCLAAFVDRVTLPLGILLGLLVSRATLGLSDFLHEGCDCNARACCRTNVLRDTCLTMKRLIAPLALTLVLAFCMAGCYGSYSASHAMNRWNGHVTGNRLVNSGIHFVLIPVYLFVVGTDIIIFNNVEFLTGSRVFN
jgi:hypothetical protein